MAAVSIAYLVLNVMHGSLLKDQWPRAVVTSTGAFALGPPGFLSNATGAWSLGIEGMFYLLFPLIALFVASTPTRALAAMFVVFLFLQQTAISVFMIEEKWWFLYTTPLTFVPFFLAGILAYRDVSSPNAVRLVISILLLAALFGYSLLWDTDIYKDRIVHSTMTVVSCAVVWIAYRATIPSSLAGIAAFLGKISYALYLTHWFVNKLLARAAIKFGLPDDLKPWLFAVLAPAVAYLCYVAFEAPAQSYLRKKLMTKRRPAVSANDGTPTIPLHSASYPLRSSENPVSSFSAEQVNRHAD